MQCRHLRRQVQPLAEAFDQQERGNFANAGLDQRREPDQLAVELGEDLLDADGFKLLAEADRTSHVGGIHVHLQTSTRCTRSLWKKTPSPLPQRRSSASGRRRHEGELVCRTEPVTQL